MDPDPKHFDQHVFMMWLMFLRAPGRKTAPGEVVDLGELGSVPEKKWSRVTPYSLAQVEPPEPNEGGRPPLSQC